MLDLILLAIATISSFFISALAWLINVICKAAMVAFLPTVYSEHMTPSGWWQMMGVSDEMNQYFPFLRPANRTFLTFALIIISVLFMFNLLKNFQPGIRREGIFAQFYRAILAVVLTALSYHIIGFGMALGYEAILKMSKQEIQVQAYDTRLGTVYELDENGHYKLDENGNKIPAKDWMVENDQQAQERQALLESFTRDQVISTEKMNQVNIGSAYKIITHEALVEMKDRDAAGDSNFDDTAQLAVIVIVPLIIMIAIAWNALKLFIEISERLVATTLITSLAPLGFCTVVTEETEGILKRYLSMVFSTYLVFIIDIWFIRAFMYCSYTYLVQYVYDVHIGIAGYIPTGFIWFLVLQLAWLIVAQRADQYLRDAGLSVAQTGGRLLGELALAGRTLTGSMRTAGRLATNGYKHFNNANKRFDNWRNAGKHHQGILPKVGGGASHVMKEAMGKDAWKAMEKAGFKPSRATDFAEAVRRNGKATGELRGRFTDSRGNSINFRSCRSTEEAASHGHGCYVNPVSGACFEVWSNQNESGARQFFAPHNTAMSEFGTDDYGHSRFDLAETSAQNYLNENGVNKDTIREAGNEYRKTLCDGDEEKMKESEAAARRLLPDDDRYSGLTPVAAGFDSRDADDVSHLTCIDNATGRFVEFDMTTGSTKSDSLFDDRSVDDRVGNYSGFSYTDDAGREVTAMVHSDISVDEFTGSLHINIEDAQELPDGSIFYRAPDEDGNMRNYRFFTSASHTQAGEGRTVQHYVNGQPGRIEELDAVEQRTVRRHSQKKSTTQTWKAPKKKSIFPWRRK